MRAVSIEPKLGLLRKVFDRIRGNRILDAAAKALLREVPVVGNFLVNLYENTAGEEEGKTRQVIQILENLQKFNQQQFDELVEIIQVNGEIIKSNKESLSRLQNITGSIVNKLDEIQDLISLLRIEGRSDIHEIKERIEKLENNLVHEIGKMNMSRFDHKMAAERLLFYLKLKYFLDNSYEIFISQNDMAHRLANQILDKGYRPTTDRKGLDYMLYDLHKNGKMDRYELEVFDYIRKVTNETERFNSYAKGLLMENEAFLNETPLLKDLLVHYSTWQAKYQLYKDDPHMCLIYVGPDQDAGFPAGIDGHIDKMVNQLRQQTKLND